MKSIPTLLTLLVCYCLSISDLQAQVFCQNNTDTPIWVAVAYNLLPPESNKDKWVSEGWLYIEPQQTIQLTTHIGYDEKLGVKTNFYYYAYQPGGREWTGPRKFLVDTNTPNSVDAFEFRVEWANRPEYYTDHPNLRYAFFKGGTNTSRKEYTIVLNQDDENEPGVAHREDVFSPKYWDVKQKEKDITNVVETW